MTAVVNNQTLSGIHLPPRIYNITTIYLICVLVLGCSLNVLAAYVLVCKDKLSSTQAVLLFSLTTSNAFFTVASTPLTIRANYKHEWEMGPAGCAYFGFVSFTGGLSSIYHLLLLSLERFIAVVYPFQVSNLLRPSYVNRSIIFGWFLILAIASLPLFGWSKYTEEGIGTSCSVDLFPASAIGISYNIFIVVIGYALPISSILYFNIKFLKEVQRIINRGRRQGYNLGRECFPMKKAERLAMKQMSLQVAALVVSFNVCWLPYAVVVIVGLFRGKPFENKRIASIPSYFAKSYTVYDPLIFFILNKNFRSLFKRCVNRNALSETSRVNSIRLETFKGAGDAGYLCQSTVEERNNTCKMILKIESSMQ